MLLKVANHCLSVKYSFLTPEYVYFSSVADFVFLLRKKPKYESHLNILIKNTVSGENSV